LDGFDLSFTDYQVISFGDFIAETGDIEGRLAARGEVKLGNGFAIGTQINSADQSSPYSIIAGSLSWGSGSLSPDSAAAGLAFVAGNYSVPAYLASKVNGTCGDNVSCLETLFDDAHSCYVDLQNELSGHVDNVDVSVTFSQLKFSCNSSENRYYATITTDQMNAATWYGISSSCNINAQFVININGTGDVDFHGDGFPANPDNVVYNILGSGRVIDVHTAVNGAILAPNNSLNQTSGVIRGKVIVGDVVFALQINKPVCDGSSSPVTFSA
jgi:choice-of-anchor A domain-containing protein